MTSREPGKDSSIPFAEAARFWIKLGFINFGGPSGQIALMHEELVDRRSWIGEGRFLHALSFCMLLPGPEAQQLAIYVGWLLHKVRGGIVAGVAFVLPSFFLILVLSWTYAVHGDVTWVAGIFAGLSAAVLGMVLAALLRIGGARPHERVRLRGGGDRVRRHLPGRGAVPGRGLRGRRGRLPACPGCAPDG